MPLRGSQISEQNRIISPYHAALSTSFSYLANVGNGLRSIGNRSFQSPRIPRYCVLNDKRKTHVGYFGKVLHHWANILRPKYDSLHGLLRKKDRLSFRIVRIENFAIPSTQTLHEPGSIEGWNVCLVTGRNNHSVLARSFQSTVSNTFEVSPERPYFFLPIR